MIINVSDVKKSSPFYTAMFRYFGYDLTGSEYGEDYGYEDWKRWDIDTPHEISICQVCAPNKGVPHRRGALGHHDHIAFCAEDRGDVDRFYSEVLRPLADAGHCTIEDAPCDCPEYSDGYYSTFFTDPDGLKYEFVLNPNHLIKKVQRQNSKAEQECGDTARNASRSLRSGGPSRRATLQAFSKKSELMPTTFREVLQADADRVAEIYLTSRKKFVPFAPLAHSDDEVVSWVADTLIPTSRVIVAESEGRLLGMMALSEDQNFGWIDHLYLDPAEVNRGIGSEFVIRAKSELRHPIRLYAFPGNLACRRFYERHGFCAIKFTDGADNEERCPDVLYEFGAAITKTGEAQKKPSTPA